MTGREKLMNLHAYWLEYRLSGNLHGSHRRQSTSPAVQMKTPQILHALVYDEESRLLFCLFCFRPVLVQVAGRLHRMLLLQTGKKLFE